MRFRGSSARGGWGGVRWDFRLRCLHWSCHWAEGWAGAPAGPLQVQGGILPRWLQGHSSSRASEHDDGAAGSQAPQPALSAAWSDRRCVQEQASGLQPAAGRDCVGVRVSSSSSSFHRILFLLLTESSNFEKKTSFCQIRRDSLWSFLRSVRTQSQPLVPGPWPMAGPPTPVVHAGLGQTQLLARLRLSKGQASSSALPARTPPRSQPALRGAPEGWGPVCSASVPADLDSRLLWSPLAPGEEDGPELGSPSLPPTARQPLPSVREFPHEEHPAPLPCGP